jgi:hypothetical protein
MKIVIMWWGAFWRFWCGQAPAQPNPVTKAVSTVTSGSRGCMRHTYPFGRPDVLKGLFKQTCPWTATNPDSWPVLPDWCNYVSVECRSAHHLFGVQSDTTTLGIADLIVVEQAMARFADVQHIVDIGSTASVESTYLGLLSRVRGGLVQLFLSDSPGTQLAFMRLSNMQVYFSDVLAKTPSVIAAVKRSHCVFGAIL